MSEDRIVIKKHGMPASTLYVQNLAEQEASIIRRIEQLLDGFERRRDVPTAWQGQQLASAIAYIADGLHTLAICELEILDEERALPDRQRAASSSLNENTAEPHGMIPIAVLRQQLVGLDRPSAPVSADGAMVGSADGAMVGSADGATIRAQATPGDPS
jgi:hypothetical protein